VGQSLCVAHDWSGLAISGRCTRCPAPHAQTSLCRVRWRIVVRGEPSKFSLVTHGDPAHTAQDGQRWQQRSHHCATVLAPVVHAPQKVQVQSGSGGGGGGGLGSLFGLVSVFVGVGVVVVVVLGAAVFAIQ
jgi:hypothetical protein